MKELENIKAKISELENKKETLSTEIAELSQAVNDSFEDLLLGKVDDKTIDKAKEKYKSLTEELEKTEEYIQRAKAVRKKLAFEKFIPFAKEKRKKKLDGIQKRYDEKAQEVIVARNELLKQLAELGQIKNEVKGENAKFNNVMIELGESPDNYGSAINERKIHSPENYTKEFECLGLKVETQEIVYKDGNVPQWVAGDSQ